MLTSLAQHYGFDIDTPYSELPEDVRQVILYGSGDEAIELTYFNDRGRSSSKVAPFEGVIPNMQRRFRETESSVVREELTKYLSHQPCPDCHGTRLNHAARHVFIDEQSLPKITAMPVDRAQQFFNALVLPGRRG